MKTNENKPNPEKADMPPVALFATVLAWIALVVGALSLMFGAADAANPNVRGGGSMSIIVGVALLFNSIIWFLGARGIALLAQIAHNTRREN